MKRWEELRDDFDAHGARRALDALDGGFDAGGVEVGDFEIGFTGERHGGAEESEKSDRGSDDKSLPSWKDRRLISKAHDSVRRPCGPCSSNGRDQTASSVITTRWRLVQ